jgi:PAS domain S-box-containing protein
MQFLRLIRKFKFIKEITIQEIVIFLIVIIGVLYAGSTWAYTENKEFGHPLQIARSVAGTLPVEDIKSIIAIVLLLSAFLFLFKIRAKNKSLKDDIAEFKRAGDVLRESEEKYRYLFDNNPQPMWIFDIETLNFIEVNRAALNHYGYSREEFLSMSLKDICPPEDIPALLKDVEKTKGYNQSGVWRYIKKNGKLIFVEITTFPVIFNGMNARSVLIHDITESKKSEEKLRESEFRFKQVSENAQELIWEVDKNGLYTYSSPVIKNLLGYEPEEIVGKKHFYDLFDLENREELKHAALRAFASKESFKNFVNINLHKDGRKIILSTSGIPLLDSEGNLIGYRGVDTDITERIHAEKELIKAKEKAEESDNLKTAFLNNVSHEIRTPFNGILGFLSLLQEDGVTTRERDEYISIINASAYRLLNTINDIVEIAQIQAGQIRLSISETNIRKLTGEVYNHFKNNVESKGLKFFFNSDLPYTLENIHTDGVKLNTILSILIGNAMKFTETGSIVFGICLVDQVAEVDQVAGTHGRMSLQFSVKDTGIGIPYSLQSKIFERFVQADSSNTRPFEGSGLGLSIAKAYVEMLGGRIWVESEEGKGSIFYFTIPYDAEQTGNNVGDTVSVNGKENQDNTEGPGLNVLIAEDAEESATLLSIVVKPYSKKVLKVRTGAETVDACRNHPDIDLVLMDIKMPDMDGYEATMQIRKFNTHVIIIAQTAYALVGDRDKAIGAGCNDYISKPFNKYQFRELIQKYFNL